MGLALAFAAWLGGLAEVTAGADHRLGTRLLVATPVCVTVVALVVVLHRRQDGATWHSLGFAGLRSDLRGFLIGLATVLACGAVVAALVTALGWAQWSGVKPSALIGFLLTNALIAMLLEAVPEEIAFRGYALTALRRAFAPKIAAWWGVLAFMLAPLIAMTAEWLLSRIVGGGTFALAPGGDDPATYYIVLATFGVLLTCARSATSSFTVWTCIGAHLAWLTVNRILLGNSDGVTVTLSADGEFVMFAGYALLAILVFIALARRVRRADSGPAASPAGAAPPRARTP